MSYDHAEVVATFQGADGLGMLELLARFDGLFEFRESRLTEFDHPMGPEKVWIPFYTSGLFASRDEAEREAHAVIVWLRQG